MSPLDWAVIIGYVVLLVGLGLVVGARRETRPPRTCERIRSLPAWAVVFSVLATEVSAATYIGVPEAGYTHAWGYLQYAFGTLLGKIVLATVFIQLLWRLNPPSAYGFLRQRVGPVSQLTAAWAFLGGRLIASGVRLYIAALAFSAATGFSMWLAILLMAALSTVYTWVGGLRAVVATDVAQGAIFLIGCAGGAERWALRPSDVPLTDLWHETLAADKTRHLLLERRRRRLVAIDAALPHGGPRRLPPGARHARHRPGETSSTCSTRRAPSPRRARSWPRRCSPSPSWRCSFPWGPCCGSTTDTWAVTAYDPGDARSIFPNFIVHALPTGIRGLVFAGLFAAAVSSLGATLNARPRSGSATSAGGRSSTRRAPRRACSTSSSACCSPWWDSSSGAGRRTAPTTWWRSPSTP
jgi:hypothetical protein